MPGSNILIVVVDGLRASALGAYGNTTFSTPALDKFAAGSLLFDGCYAPTADLGGIYGSLFCSRHPARYRNSRQLAFGGQITNNSLPKLFATAGYQTTLITDEPRLEFVHGADAFQNHVQIPHDGLGAGTPRRADDDFETELARVFAAASEAIDGQCHSGGAAIDSREPRLIWLHARGMYGMWDAPLENQNSLRDEGDPPPVESVEPPDFVTATDGDPDAVFRYSCAYAAQAIAFDTCWQRLLEFVNEGADDDRWLIILIGARGFPLGEHGRIGGVDSRLYAEQLHVPWLIRFPDGCGTLARECGLVTHLDVLPTLVDWLGDGVGAENGRFDGVSALPSIDKPQARRRDALLSVAGDDGYAIRSAGWCLRDTPEQPAESTTGAATGLPELFVRPDDRWEANDVSKLCPHVVDELRAVAREMRQTYAGNERRC
jgi:arylsulfatase A-like enzyme